MLTKVSFQTVTVISGEENSKTTGKGGYHQLYLKTKKGGERGKEEQKLSTREREREREAEREREREREACR